MPDSEQEIPWRRVHPISPILKSWHIIAVAAAGLGEEFLRQVSHGQGGDGNNPGEGAAWLARNAGLWIALGVVGMLVVLGVAVGASWWFSRYRVTDQALEQASGVIARRHRSARLDRIQAVDVVQPFVARLVGLARVKVDVAGGHDSKILLAYLTEKEAMSLRNLLLARAAGVAHEGEEAPEAPIAAQFRIRTDQLLISTAVGPEGITLVVGSALLVTSMLALGGGATSLAPIVPAMLGFAGVVWNRLNRGFAFEVSAAADGLRLKHGLLEQVQQTLPPGRVQAVRISQPLTWRPWGWWRLDINVAGYGARANSREVSETVLLPVGLRGDALTVLHLLWPNLFSAEGAVGALDGGLTGSGPAPGFTGSPASARLLDPLGYRRNGYSVTPLVLVIRRGALRREVMVVPHERTQSVGVAQGPLQRRLGLATVKVHSTPGPVRPFVPHLSLPDAQELVRGQSERARLARSVAGAERWIGGDELDQPAEAAEAVHVQDLGQV